MLLTNTPSLFFDFGSQPLPDPLAFAQHSVTFANNVVFLKRSQCRLLATLPTLFTTFWLANPPISGTPLGRLRSLFWNNNLAVPLNCRFPEICKSMILNNPPILFASLCYWPFPLEVYVEATLHQFCKILIFTTSRGNVNLKHTPSRSLLFATDHYHGKSSFEQ